MDVNKIFNVFSESPLEEEDKQDYIKWQHTPTYSVGMFKKIIVNHNNIKKTIIKALRPNANLSDIEFEDLESLGQFVTYNRAWEYIKHFDLTSEVWVDSLSILYDNAFESSLNSAILFFENIEEYEKCSLLSKIKNLLSI